MTLDELTRGLPPPRIDPGTAEHLRRGLVSGDTRIAVVDDDPTGTQTVQDVWVTTSWEPGVLMECLAGPEPLFFVSTNSRSLDTESCRALSEDVGRSLRKAATHIGRRVILASRSDSTLRGHFPGELVALARGLGQVPAAVLLVPAFFEGGRYTVGDVHWAAVGKDLVPASETEFASDPVFGYRARDLRAWVEEKTQGAIRGDQVASLPLDHVRAAGPDGVASVLREVARRPATRTQDGPLGTVVICNAVCYEDLAAIARGASIVEQEGIPLAYRTAASFVKARAGVPTRDILTGTDLCPTRGPGLVVAGSYTDRTTRQLASVVDAGLARSIELDAAQLLDPARRGAAVQDARARAEDALRSGINALVHTTRGAIRAPASEYLAMGKRIMDGLCDLVRGFRQPPAWIVAKGGVTSIEMARRALSVMRARVLGQAAPGAPVWRLGPESRHPGLTYVVFPGNVGDDHTLRAIVRELWP